MTVDLAVERHGREAGPETETFLLIHGYAATRYSWRHWMERLGERGRVLAVDLKGFGSAPKPDDGKYGIADQAELLRSLVDDEDPGRLTIIGHSMGGAIGTLLALRMGESDDARLRRLVVIAGSTHMQPLPPFVTLARYPRSSRAGLRVIGTERVVRHVLRSIVYDPATVDDAQVAAYSEALKSDDGLRAALEVGRQIVPPNHRRLAERYPRITVPTLIMWGDRDRVVPLATGRKLESALPSAELHVLERCGHIPHEERPDESWSLLEDFLNRT